MVLKAFISISYVIQLGAQILRRLATHLVWDRRSIYLCSEVAMCAFTAMAKIGGGTTDTDCENIG